MYGGELKDADTQGQTGVFAEMNRAASFLRREIAPRLLLGRVPEVAVYGETVSEQAQRLDAIFAEIESDASPSDSTATPSDSTAVPAAGAVDSESE